MKGKMPYLETSQQDGFMVENPVEEGEGRTWTTSEQNLSCK